MARWSWWVAGKRASGAVLDRYGWFAPGLIHSSAESLHYWGVWWLELV